MKKLYLPAIMIATIPIILFNACGMREGSVFEDLYTDVKVVKPSSHNYGTSTGSTKEPILKEPKSTVSSTEEKKSVHLHKTGRIIDTSFDEEVKLYLYTLLSKDGEHTIFYYDKKLNFPSSALIDVDILDNYLITAKKHTIKSSLPIKEKKRYIKHKKRNYKIREAIEEKIDTF